MIRQGQKIQGHHSNIMPQKIAKKLFVKPEIKLKIFSPMFDSVIDFPVTYLAGTVTSVRSIISGNGRITLNIKGSSSYTVQINGQDQQLRFHELFCPMAFVQLLSFDSEYGKFRQINITYVSERQVTIAASGSVSRSITLPTVDNLLKENEFFLDMHHIAKDGIPRTSEKFAGLLKSAADLVSKSTNIKMAVSSIWDNLFYKLIFGTLVGGPKLYGGKKIIATTTEGQSGAILSPKVTGTSYTVNLVMESNLMSSLNVGQDVNFFDILNSYSSPPMYEIFADPLESVGGENTPDKSGVLSIGLPKTKAELASGWQPVQKYTVPSFGAVLVFRQTPFCYFDKDGKWNKNIDPFYEIDAKGIKNISFSEKISEISSGVHVTMNVYENAGSVINPPKYNSNLLKIFGQKPLHVKMAGLSPRENFKKADQENYKTELDKIRDMLFNIFCNEKDLKIASGSISIPYGFVRAGIPFSITNRYDTEMNPDVSKALEEIGEFGYITTVTDTFDPKGKAGTDLEYKWMESPIQYGTADVSQASAPPMMLSMGPGVFPP